jgi:hypothetical protein
MTLARSTGPLALSVAGSTGTSPHATTLAATSQSSPPLTSEFLYQALVQFVRNDLAQDHSLRSYRPQANLDTWLEESSQQLWGGARRLEEEALMYDGPMPKVGDHIQYISWSHPYLVTRVSSETTEFWIKAAGGSAYRYGMSKNFIIISKDKPKSGFAKFVNAHSL